MAARPILTLWLVCCAITAHASPRTDPTMGRSVFTGATHVHPTSIGLNPAARITDDITESKKCLGTAHMAMGDSAGGYGGTVVSDVHLDGILMTPTIEVDGRPIAADGRILV